MLRFKSPGSARDPLSSACRRLQNIFNVQRHLHLGQNAPRASRCGDGHMADRRRSWPQKNPEPSTLCARPHGNVTIPAIVILIVRIEVLGAAVRPNCRG